MAVSVLNDRGAAVARGNRSARPPCCLPETAWTTIRRASPARSRPARSGRRAHRSDSARRPFRRRGCALLAPRSCLRPAIPRLEPRRPRSPPTSSPGQQQGLAPGLRRRRLQTWTPTHGRAPDARLEVPLSGSCSAKPTCQTVTSLERRHRLTSLGASWSVRSCRPARSPGRSPAARPTRSGSRSRASPGRDRWRR